MIWVRRSFLDRYKVVGQLEIQKQALKLTSPDQETRYLFSEIKSLEFRVSLGWSGADADGYKVKLRDMQDNYHHLGCFKAKAQGKNLKRECEVAGIVVFG